MSKELDYFKYIHIDNGAPKNLFLFHGTGGDEYDLLSIGELVKDKYNLISLRGNVVENGMFRFFKRISFGVFDQENIKIESEKLSKFISSWNEENNSNADKNVFLGYSNGGNMIIATMFYHPEVIKNAVCMHSMQPFEVTRKLDLAGHKVCVTYGANDTMISSIESTELISTLKKLHVNVTVFKYNHGHAISNEEVQSVTKFLKLL